jgi:hypothetical protein
VKDLEKRATVADLLKHPFLAHWAKVDQRRLSDELAALAKKYAANQYDISQIKHFVTHVYRISQLNVFIL